MYKEAIRNGDILYGTQYDILLQQLIKLSMQNKGVIEVWMVDIIQIGDETNVKAVKRVIQAILEMTGGKIIVSDEMIKQALNENIYPSDVYKKLGISPEKVYKVLKAMNKGEREIRIESFLKTTEFLTYILDISVDGESMKVKYESETFYAEMQKLENSKPGRVKLLIELSKLYYILGLPRETILRPLNRIINSVDYSQTTKGMVKEIKGQISEHLTEDKKQMDELEHEK